MKKTIRNSSKRKWIVGGVAFFGAVALLTTGFATWVVGANQNQDKEGVTVTVDSAENNSMQFDITSTGLTINVGEGAVVTNGKILNVPQEGITTPDFEITVEWSLTAGNAIADTITGIEFKLEDTNNTGTDLLTPVSDPDITGADLTARSSSRTYLELVTSGDSDTYSNTYTHTITDTEWNEDSEESSVKTIAHGTTTLEFYWGDFFANKLPSTFYNGLTYGDDSKADIVACSDYVFDELSAMEDSLEKGLTITATVSTDSAE